MVYLRASELILELPEVLLEAILGALEVILGSLEAHFGALGREILERGSQSYGTQRKPAELGAHLSSFWGPSRRHSWGDVWAFFGVFGV